MSELKATTAQEIVRTEKYCDYMDELFGGVKMPPTQVYLKSEADKVIAELKEERRWRKFSDEKPEKDQWCLVYHEGEIDADHYTDHCNNHCRFVMYGHYVTHWMPLPSAPKEEK